MPVQLRVKNMNRRNGLCILLGTRQNANLDIWMIA